MVPCGHGRRGFYRVRDHGQKIVWIEAGLVVADWMPKLGRADKAWRRSGDRVLSADVVVAS